MGELKRTRVALSPEMFSFGNEHRTPGIHLTDIVHDMLEQAGIAKKYKLEAEGGFTQADLDAFALQGFLWEEVFSDQIATIVLKRNNQYVRIGEIACPMTSDDGQAFIVEYDAKGNLLTPIPPRHIIMTVDALRIEPAPNNRVSLAEFKWTTKSAKMNPEDSRPDWFYQVKGYLKGVKELLGRRIERVEWHVQFACGERWGTAPIYAPWEREYSERDIEDCWESLVGHTERRVLDDPAHRWAQYL